MDARAPRAGSRLATALCVSLGLAGCATDIGQLGRAVGGHLSVMQASRPVQDWMDDPSTSPALRSRLELSQALRDFSIRTLKLPDNASYRRYADLGRPAVLWNVVAAPELDLRLKTWCYPVVGCVGYRGHFDEGRAQREAQALRLQGWEVQVVPVTAYSTLGWTQWMGGDPLLNTFALGSPIELARLLFHELAHQVAYAPGDMAFSESFATAVERLGLAHWAADPGSAAVGAAQWRAWEERQARRQALMKRVDLHREQLQALYRSRMADEARRERKVALREQFQREYRQLRDEQWGGDKAFDAWVGALNNATLALHGSYADGVPAFLRLFEQQGRDFDRFYAEVRRLAALDAEARRAALEALSRPAP